jgi:hypothetical protein
VLWVSEYSHTAQGVRPLITYQPGQTYQTTESGTANANIYGTGGSAYGSGPYSSQSTTTSSGTYNTQYVPYQQRIYNNGASFWRRLRPGVLGAMLNPIPEDLRSKLQRNTGAYVVAVLVDGPAFRANMLAGDIVIEAGGKDIASPQELMLYLPAHAGEQMTFTILRGTETLRLPVKLNSQGQ